MDNRIKILVVDDEVQSLETCGAMLANAGYQVLKATSAGEGIAVAEQEIPSLIISDYYMPNVDGIEFCREIKDHTVLRDTMFMLLTGATETENRIRGLDGGADDYVAKPIEPRELLSRVRALLRITVLQEELKRDNAELEKLHTVLQNSFSGVVTLLTHIIGIRVPNATARAQRAATVGQWIGRRLGIKEDELKQLEISALLHEVGKISLPDAILRTKREELSQADEEAFSQFPLFSQLLVGSVPQLEPIALALRHQMENYDGTGIPDRLRKVHIPLSSRILRATNLLEDATARADCTTADLVGLVDRARGTILDPHIVQLLLEYLEVRENPSWNEGKEQVLVNDLGEGMVLAMDLCTGSGMKLLPKKSTLTQSNITRILALHKVDPIINEIYVYTTAPVG